MRIVHCLNQYMPQAMAGTEIYTHTLATLQKKDGYNVAVITPHIEHYRPGKIKEHYVYDGIDVYQFLEKADPTNRQVHYGVKKPEGLNLFNQLLKALKPDIIHFHELNRSIGLTVEHVKLAKKSGAKVFLTMHLSSYSCNTNVLIYDDKLCDGIIRDYRCTVCSYQNLFDVPASLAKPLSTISMAINQFGFMNKLPDSKTKTLLSVPATIKRIENDLQELTANVDQLVSYSKWYRHVLIRNGVPDNKLSVVPAALVTVKPVNASKKIFKIGKPIKLVFMGRIQPTKGIHLIIEAMRSFDAKDVVIDLYGKEEDTAYYKQCIKNCESLETVSFKGELKRDQVLEKLAEYDMFCLASTFSEMSPLVIQESFAAGIPVLASKVHGNLEHIADGHNGLLFEFNSVTSLTQKIQQLLNESGLLEHLHGNILQPASFIVVHEAYLKLYKA